MKRCICSLLALLCVGAVWGRTVRDFSLAGEIDGENITFKLAFRVDGIEKGTHVPLVSGDVAYIDGDFPRGAELVRQGDGFSLRFDRRIREGRPVDLVFSFASRPERDGEWRQTGFDVPVGTIRELAVTCDRTNLDIEFPGALNTVRSMDEEGRTVVTANLGVGRTFQVRWKPQLKRLAADLVVSCDASTLATAGVGALRLDNVYTFSVIQGEMRELSLDVPDVSVTRVSGDAIQDWRLTGEEGAQCLKVRLSRPCVDSYELRVEAEKILPAFPCSSVMPVLAPRDVIRTSGFLLVGTDSAIKLQVSKAAGLTQIDSAGFPLAPSRKAQAPRRRLYAYQYANLPYGLSFTADDIVTSLDTDSYVVLRLADSEVTLDVSLEVDVKDAPTPALQLDMAAMEGWTVTQISGREVADADADVREENGRRVIYVPFKKPLLGTGLVKVRLERSLTPGESTFAVPSLNVQDARSQRGYVVVAAERGVRLNADKVEGLREIHTGSAPVAVEGAQHAYRFRDGAWALSLTSEQAQPSVHCEAFHLVSLGEGVSYSSVALTYHIGGAPIQELVVRVPEDSGDIDVTGADVESWSREGELCHVRLHTRTIGDYTLLLTYDGQYDYRGGTVQIGGVETVGAESEVGYVIVSSASSIQVSEATNLPPSVIAIGREELPAEYAAPVTAPILKSYKYVRLPHRIHVGVRPLPTETLLTQVADYVSLQTRIGNRGGVETTATYYLKNASRQFLVIQPPKGSKPWYARRVLDDGTKEALTMQERDGAWLVPVERPRDPNMALTLEVTYAQQVSELGGWRTVLGGIRLMAPQLPETHAAIAGWTVSVPEGYAIASPQGNMVASTQLVGGMRGVLVKCKRVIVALLSPLRTVRDALGGGLGVPRQLSFTRTVNLTDGTSPELRLYVVPAWMGGAGSMRTLLLWCAGGVVCLLWGLVRRRRLLLPLGVAAIMLGLAESAMGRSAVAVVLLLLVLLAGMRVAWWCVLRLLLPVWRVHRETAARRREERRARQVPPPLPSPWGSDEPEADEADNADREGSVCVKTLPVMLAIGLAALCAGASVVQVPETPPADVGGLVMDRVDIRIVAPGSDVDAGERSALVEARYLFETTERMTLPLLPANCVVLSYSLSGRDATLQANDNGYFADLPDAGTHEVALTYRLPVEDRQGIGLVGLHLPANMRNRVVLEVPEQNLDVKADQAVLFRSHEEGSNTVAEAVFGPVSDVWIGWKPRMRRTQLEEVVMFSELNSWVVVKPGVLDFTHRAECRIAQGETRSLVFTMPEGMSVTSVSAPELATWRFDPLTRKLDVVFSRPMAGTVVLAVTTQVAAEGLPYTAVFGVPVLEGANRQRGAITLAGPASVQLRVDKVEALSPMNTEDFNAETVALAGGSHAMGAVTARRAFRYHKPTDVQVSVRAERVLPEVRVVETGSVSVSDERTVLSTRLDLAISKAGVFDVVLELPAGFDLETLSGADVSHWDDMPGTNGVRRVVVTFARQLEGASTLNLVVARMAQGVERSFDLPKVGVDGAVKHTGRLTVASERGVRLSTQEHEGVDVRKPVEVGLRQPGVLVFDLLRPSWRVVLRSDVLTPTVKPEVLQWVTLVEGMLQCNAYIQYRIENAGVKSFQLRCPSEQATMTVTGRGVARVLRVEGDPGLWQVDLHGKVENSYQLRASYQIPYRNEDNRVVLSSLQAVGTDDQRGYLVVTCDTRIQVVPESDGVGLKVEDARNVPSTFGAGDLSHAILCYRTVRPAFSLPLAVVRNAAAEVLPASVTRMNISSALSEDRRMLTAVDTELRVGDLRYLKVSLPGDGSLWTALVDGKEVPVSRKDGKFLLPLDPQSRGVSTRVQFSYSGRFDGAHRRRALLAPSFEGLPLRDITWDIYLPRGVTCYGFGGTMEPDRDGWQEVSFGASQYQQRNKEKMAQTLEMAQQELSKGELMLKQGNTYEARKAFEQAYNYSLGKQALNEDARVQLRNLAKKQFKVGLFNRRRAVRVDNNIVDVQAGAWGQQQSSQPQMNADVTQQDDLGNFTEMQVLQVEEQLAEQNDAIDEVADKMVGQQVAAAGVLKGIQVTLPAHGQLIRFKRDLQIVPEGELSVSFKVRGSTLMRQLSRLGALLALFIVFLATRLALRNAPPTT